MKYTPIDTLTDTALCVRCIICDEPVELTPEEILFLSHKGYVGSKVCDKCKQAVMCIRDWIENGQHPTTQNDVIPLDLGLVSWDEVKDRQEKSEL